MTGSSKLRAAVFLDRDGTINVEKNYIYRYED
jgi:histidinol phosphatase-like enzyme